MSKNPETALVPFHGHQLLTIKDGDTIRVAMKPICEAIGIDWNGQYQRINRHPVLLSCMCVIHMQLPGDSQGRDIVTLPLDVLNGWLFGIDAGRAKPEIQDRLVDYQRECFAALAAYWMQGVANNPRARAATIPQVLSTQRHANGLMKALKRETVPAVRRVLHDELSQACRLLGIECPALSEIGREEVPDWDSPLIGEFWELMDLLLDESDSRQLNHARTEGLIAFSFPQVQAAAAALRVPLPKIDDLRRVIKHSKAPKFLGVKAVNSRHRDGTVKCWVFERSDETGEA